MERGLLRRREEAGRKEEVGEEREGPAATISLRAFSFHAEIKVPMLTHADGSWSVVGSCSSVMSGGTL